MNRLQALVIVLILWAAIFLPGLGSTEIKGEEGRRILPAVTMLDEGDWLMAHVGGKPFLRKPPLINWLIAASFKVTGARNEWTARMPSILCVLALALTIVALSSGRGWMTPETGLIAAIFVMVQFGLLAKARFAGAEIEGIYVPISGLAMVTWMAWWCQRRSPWLTWTVPFIFLGIAALAKGPSLHLLFFYAVVLGSLWSARQWRPLWSPPHFVGLAIASGIFAAWAVPFFNSPEAVQAAAVWKRQGIDRFTENDFNLVSYLLNIPRGLVDQLPWLLLCPVLIAAARRPHDDSPTANASLPSPRFLASVGGAILLCFLLLLLIPGVLPRYVLPLGIPFALLLAVALQREGDRLPALRQWHRINGILAGLLLAVALLSPLAASVSLTAASFGAALEQIDYWLAVRGAFVASFVIAGSALVLSRRSIHLRAVQLAVTTAALCGGAALLYASAAVRWINRADDVRPLAAQIDASIPPGKHLVIYDPGFFPAIFYLSTPYTYAAKLEDIPPEADYILAREQSLKKFTAKRSDLHVIQTLSRKEKQNFLLLQRSIRISNDPLP